MREREALSWRVAELDAALEEAARDRAEQAQQRLADATERHALEAERLRLLDEGDRLQAEVAQRRDGDEERRRLAEERERLRAELVAIHQSVLRRLRDRVLAVPLVGPATRRLARRLVR